MAAVGIEASSIRSHIRNYSCSSSSNSAATQQQRMAALTNITGWLSCMKGWWLQCNMELDLVSRPHGKMKIKLEKKRPWNCCAVTGAHADNRTTQSAKRRVQSTTQAYSTLSSPRITGFGKPQLAGGQNGSKTRPPL